MDLQLISGLGLPGLLFLAAFVFMQIALTELLKVVLAKERSWGRGGVFLLPELGGGQKSPSAISRGDRRRGSPSLPRGIPWSRSVPTPHLSIRWNGAQIDWAVGDWPSPG